MRNLEFVSCPDDPDVWIHINGTEYYEYLILYTDDAMRISDNDDHVLRNELGQYFLLKEVRIGPPKIYLGGHVQKVQLENGVER